MDKGIIWRYKLHDSVRTRQIKKINDWARSDSVEMGEDRGELETRVPHLKQRAITLASWLLPCWNVGPVLANPPFFIGR